MPTEFRALQLLGDPHPDRPQQTRFRRWPQPHASNWRRRSWSDL